MGGAGEGGSNIIGDAHDVTARAALDLAFGVDLDRRAALEPIEQAWPTPINAPRERGEVRRGLSVSVVMMPAATLPSSHHRAPDDRRCSAQIRPYRLGARCRASRVF